MAGMDNAMGSETRREVLAKLPPRYQGAGRLHCKKLIDRAVELLGYHRKPTIRALAAAEEAAGVPRTNTGHPALDPGGFMVPWTRPQRGCSLNQKTAVEGGFTARK